MEVRIVLLESLKLMGIKTRMSVSNAKTEELWKTFMPRRKEIGNRIGSDYYSIEVYDNLDYFKAFNPEQTFEKWAAIEVENGNSLPKNMDYLTIPRGNYAVFTYKGKPSEALRAFQYIFGEWIPKSKFSVDDRPHFAQMGEKYLGEYTNSKEELWIPIKSI